MTEQNRNSFPPAALSFSAHRHRAQIRHPFFDTTGFPNRLECLAAINRAACVIELFNHLDLSGEQQGELSPGAVSGYRYLTEAVHETLTYSSRRLEAMSRKRRNKMRRQARYLSAFSKSLVALNTVDRDDFLNAMASRLQLMRSDVDGFIDRTS